MTEEVLGPRARALGLSVEKAKPKKKKKKKQLKSKPKKQKAKVNVHDPKSKSKSYPKGDSPHTAPTAPVKAITMEELLKIVESHKFIPEVPITIPNVLTYEVEYLDEEE